MVKEESIHYEVTTCDRCGKEMPSGTSGYCWKSSVYCEDCFDNYILDDIKEECEIECEDEEIWS